MEIFISWSGTKSGACAVALKQWLPCVIQSLEPWCSSEDITKGARGGLEIAKKLGEVNFGIVCLTPSNLHNEWIHFESGALSKNLDGSALFTFLIELQPLDVKPPLGHFQHTKGTRDEVLKLVESINSKVEKPLDSSLLKRMFDRFWPELEEILKNLPVETIAPSTTRPDREILEEILSAVRGQQNSKSTNTDDLPRKARDLGIFTEAFLRSRGYEGKVTVSPEHGDFHVGIPMHNAIDIVVVPGKASFPAAKDQIAAHISENDIPF